MQCELAHEIVEPAHRRREQASALAPLAQRNSARWARSPRAVIVRIRSSIGIQARVPRAMQRANAALLMRDRQST
jgi:hypothetical protein